MILLVIDFGSKMRKPQRKLGKETFLAVDELLAVITYNELQYYIKENKNTPIFLKIPKFSCNFKETTKHHEKTPRFQ